MTNDLRPVSVLSAGNPVDDIVSTAWKITDLITALVSISKLLDDDKCVELVLLDASVDGLQESRKILFAILKLWGVAPS